MNTAARRVSAGVLDCRSCHTHSMHVSVHGRLYPLHQRIGKQEIHKAARDVSATVLSHPPFSLLFFFSRPSTFMPFTSSLPRFRLSTS